MTTTKLDEFAAWCEMAMICESGERGINHQGWVLVDWHDGLCGMNCFRDDKGYAWGDLECAIERRMCNNVGSSRWHELWLWPLTDKGWADRTKFCWRMAEQCAQELDGAT